MAGAELPRWRRTLGANAVGQPGAQPVGVRGDLLRAFPRRHPEVHRRCPGDRDRAEWYLRQMLGAANFKAGPLLGFASGNLCYQIEHHLFPDLPSNRLAEIAERVRPLCEKYGLPYLTVRLRINMVRRCGPSRLALPDGFLGASDSDIAAVQPRGRVRPRKRVAVRRRERTPDSRRRFASRAA